MRCKRHASTAQHLSEGHEHEREGGGCNEACVRPVGKRILARLTHGLSGEEFEQRLHSSTTSDACQVLSAGAAVLAAGAVLHRLR